MNNISLKKFPLGDPVEILKKMPKAYEQNFNMAGIDYLRKVQKAMINNKAVLNIAENDRGSFFYKFVKFHSGAFNKENLNLLDSGLKEFCMLCGRIESLTDHWPLLEKEPTNAEINKLIKLLDIFFKILPSRELFNDWVKSSVQNICTKKTNP